MHVSAAAQIGGVLEPVGALPVIIEDDVLVGGNCGVYEGAVVKRRAVLAAGTILTGVDADLRSAERAASSSRRPGQPLIVPEGAVVVPGARPVTSGAGPASGGCRWPRRSSSSIATSGPTRGRRSKHGSARRRVAFARALIDIDSTTGRERAAGDWLARRLRARGYTRDRAAAGAWLLERPRHARSTRTSCSRRTTIACRRSSRARRRDGRLYGRGACDAKGILAAQVAAAERLRAERRAARRPAVRGRRGARQRRRRRWPSRTAPASRYLINGEPTDSRLGDGDARRAAREAARARARRAIPPRPEQGESAIDKLIDALIRLRGAAAAVRPGARQRRTTRSG